MPAQMCDFHFVPDRIPRSPEFMPVEAEHAAIRFKSFGGDPTSQHWDHLIVERQVAPGVSALASADQEFWARAAGPSPEVGEAHLAATPVLIVRRIGSHHSPATSSIFAI